MAKILLHGYKIFSLLSAEKSLECNNDVPVIAFLMTQITPLLPQYYNEQYQIT